MHMLSPRPNLLYLVHRFPYPPNRGDRIRSFHLLDFLAQRANVYLGTLADEAETDEAQKELAARCHSVEVRSLGPARWFHAATSIAKGNSATEGLFWNRSLKGAIRRWAAETRFDLAVIFCSSMVPYLLVPELRNVAAIVDLVDVDSQKWFDYAAQSLGLRKRLFELEGRRLRRLEYCACQRTGAVVTVSQAEAELFRRICPNDHTFAIPNGVDLDYFRPLSGEGQPGRCVFVGALDYHANIDGICWFCREVWPAIRDARSDATLAIVGRNPTTEIQRLSSLAGVSVFGDVPDVRPFLAEAAIAIAPLRIARGIQNKVLEAMACGRPVVTSPAALLGLQAAPGVHVLTAETPVDWRDAIVHLFDAVCERRRLCLAARRYVECRHNWQACFEPFARLLDHFEGMGHAIVAQPPQRILQGSGRAVTSRV